MATTIEVMKPHADDVKQIFIQIWTNLSPNDDHPNKYSFEILQPFSSMKIMESFYLCFRYHNPTSFTNIIVW